MPRLHAGFSFLSLPLMPAIQRYQDNDNGYSSADHVAQPTGDNVGNNVPSKLHASETLPIFLHGGKCVERVQQVGGTYTDQIARILPRSVARLLAPFGIKGVKRPSAERLTNAFDA
jgi:hypothetical protein